MGRPGLLGFALLATVLAGCVQPAPTEATESSGASPARPLLLAAGGPSAPSAAPTQLVPVAQGDAPGGYALRLWDDKAYVATFTSQEGVSIFDIADPLHPVHLGGLPGQFARSVDLHADGARVAAAISTGDDLQVWDVTDPLDPAQLASLGVASHNVVTHPDGVVYNARNLWDNPVGGVEIVDARNLEDIHLDHVWTFPPQAADGTPVVSTGCHDLTVWPGEERAYCAAYTQTLVWDLADPWNPVILTAITNPLITDHHTAFPILDHTVLVVGDEFAANFAWGCYGHPLPDPLAGVHTPLGALWFYDLTTPKPEILGWVGAPPTLPDEGTPLMGPMCTSHNGMEVGEGTGLIAYGWFRAGVVLVDASDPTHPQVLDRDDIGGAVGDARWRGGYVFAADDEVGLTVLAAQ